MIVTYSMFYSTLGLGAAASRVRFDAVAWLPGFTPPNNLGICLQTSGEKFAGVVFYPPPPARSNLVYFLLFPGRTHFSLTEPINCQHSAINLNVAISEQQIKCPYNWKNSCGGCPWAQQTDRDTSMQPSGRH